MCHTYQAPPEEERFLFSPCVRAEPIMLKLSNYAMLHCSKNLPIMLNKCPYYVQIKWDPHSENQPSGLFQVCLGGVYFHNFSMLADIGPHPYKV